MSEVVTVTGDDFAGTTTREGSVLTTKLRGTADYSAIDALDKLLTETHAAARSQPPTEVVVDLRDLEFMNSSCFKSFVSWITDVQELEPAAQYKVRFLSNPKLHWQKRSLHSLRCFAVELITVTES